MCHRSRRTCASAEWGVKCSVGHPGAPRATPTRDRGARSWEAGLSLVSSWSLWIPFLRWDIEFSSVGWMDGTGLGAPHPWLPPVWRPDWRAARRSAAQRLQAFRFPNHASEIYRVSPLYRGPSPSNSMAAVVVPSPEDFEHHPHSGTAWSREVSALPSAPLPLLFYSHYPGADSVWLTWRATGKQASSAPQPQASSVPSQESSGISGT